MSGQKPFVINVYEPDLKLICYSMLEALDPELLMMSCIVLMQRHKKRTKAHLKAT